MYSAISWFTMAYHGLYIMIYYSMIYYVCPMWGTQGRDVCWFKTPTIMNTIQTKTWNCSDVHQLNAISFTGGPRVVGLSVFCCSSKAHSWSSLECWSVPPASDESRCGRSRPSSRLMEGFSTQKPGNGRFYWESWLGMGLLGCDLEMSNDEHVDLKLIYHK